MKRFICVFVVLLGVVPAFAQDSEEALRALGMGGIFATGDLALRDIDRANDPVQQLKRYFVEAKQPLTTIQVRQLDAIVDAQRTALHKAGNNEEGVARLNQEFMRRINGVLTPEQATSWRRFRTEQIMLRGGFPALRLILENAGHPLSAEQEKNALTLYREFDNHVTQMMRESNGNPDRAVLDKSAAESLAKVVRLLNTEQRRALIARRGPSRRP